MTNFQIVKILNPNPNGKSITVNSYVKFKTTNSTQEPGIYHQGHMAKNQFSQPITDILLKLRQGQSAQVMKQNKQGQDQKIVLEVTQVKEDNQPIKEPFQQAQQLKTQGNDFIKQKLYDQALTKYQQGYDLIQYDASTQATPVKLSLLSNLTLAYLNTKMYQKCIKSCDQHMALSLQPNKKIIYRKANANKALRNWAQAQNDIKLGLDVCENDQQGRKDFDSLLQTMKKQKKQQDQKQRKVYSKMFG